MYTHDMHSYRSGTRFDATDMDAPSSQLIAFVNLDSHPQCSDDCHFPFTTFLLLPLCCTICFLLGSYCLTACNCMLCHMPPTSRARSCGRAIQCDRRLRFFELRLQDSAILPPAFHNGVASDRLATTLDFAPPPQDLSWPFVAIRLRNPTSHEFGSTLHIVYEPNPNPRRTV